MTNGTGIKDRYELPLTTESPKAAEKYVESVDRFLAQIYGADLALDEAIEADEGLAIAHAAKALFQMYAMNMAGARETIAHARKLAVNSTKREQQHIQAISLMIEGNGHKTLRLIREHLDEFPRDMLMVRLANRLLILGCSGAGIPNFPEELLSMLKPLKSEYGEDWAFLGQYAFAHHETGYFDDSLKYAERSLSNQTRQRQRLPLGRPRLLRDRRPRWWRRLPRRLAGRLRPPRPVQRPPLLAPRTLPARHRQARERRVSLRGPDTPIRCEEEPRLPRRQRLSDVAHEDLRRRPARSVGGGPRDRSVRRR